MPSGGHTLSMGKRRQKPKNEAAVALGALGGRRSMLNRTPEERQAMARKGAKARWGLVKAKRSARKRRAR